MNSSKQTQKLSSSNMLQKKSTRPIILLRRSSCGAITTKSQNVSTTVSESKSSVKMALPRLHSMPDINHSRAKNMCQFGPVSSRREQIFTQYPSVKIEPSDENIRTSSSMWRQSSQIPIHPAGSQFVSYQQPFQMTKNYYFGNGGPQIINDQHIQSTGQINSMGQVFNGQLNCQAISGIIPMDQKCSNGYGPFYCPTGVLDCENIRPRSVPNMRPHPHSNGFEQQGGYPGQAMAMVDERQLKPNVVDDSLTNITWLGHMGVNNFLPMRVEKDGSHIRQLPLRSLKSGRPPYSYMALIQFAINSSPIRRMTLRQIYIWIEETFPYFKMAKPGWKNSIRHNLSLHDIFVREVSVSSKASYWTLRPDLNMRPLTLESIKGDAQHMFRPCHMIEGSSWDPEVLLQRQKSALPQISSSQPYLLFPLSGKTQQSDGCGTSMSATRDCSSLFADSGCHSDMSMMTPSSTTKTSMMSAGYKQHYPEISSEYQSTSSNDVITDNKDNIKVRKRPRKQPLKTLNDSLNSSLHFDESKSGKSPENSKKLIKIEKEDFTDFRSAKENSSMFGFGSPNSFSEILNDLETPYKSLFSKDIVSEEEIGSTPPRKKCKKLQYQKFTNSPGFNEDLDAILRQHSHTFSKAGKVYSTPGKEGVSTHDEYHQPTSTPICDEKYGRKPLRSLTPSRFLCSPQGCRSEAKKLPFSNIEKNIDNGFNIGTGTTSLHDKSVKHFVSPSSKKVILGTYSQSPSRLNQISTTDLPSSTSNESPMKGFLPSVFGADCVALNNSFSKLLDLSGISLLGASGCSPSKFSDIVDVSWSNLPEP
uniref:uncharacterized protein LOC120334288 n=1 Tax=Styela clava TaxID=7725 RepID=UPI00193ADA72|nr:uncharacterized protein LOC120334288 [Styela clava]